MKALTRLTLSAAIALGACSHHNTTSAQPTNLYVGTENLQSNYAYHGQLGNARDKSMRSLLREACGNDCQDYSPQAIVTLVISSDTSQGVVTVTFPSLRGDQAPVAVSRQVRIRLDRRGSSISFQSDDLSGRLGDDGQLTLSSRDGLIGAAQIDNL